MENGMQVERRIIKHQGRCKLDCVTFVEEYIGYRSLEELELCLCDYCMKELKNMKWIWRFFGNYPDI